MPSSVISFIKNILYSIFLSFRKELYFKNHRDEPCRKSMKKLEIHELHLIAFYGRNSNNWMHLYDLFSCDFIYVLFQFYSLQLSIIKEWHKRLDIILL